MQAFVSALTDTTDGITSANLWGELTAMVPVIVMGVLFALGYRFVRRGINGISKGKAKI